MPDDLRESRRPSEIELGRRGFRRRQGTRSVLIAVLSTIVFAVIVWITIVNTPGWSSVQQSFFDPATWAKAWPRVFAGFLLNIRVLLVAAVGVVIFGTLIAAIRTLRGAVFFPLRALAAGYTDLFRGLPLIIVLYLVGFGIPGLRLTETRVPAEVWGTVALILTYSAYVAEVIRAGIEAVHPSQLLAARALGLSHARTMRLIVLPQAMRALVPPLGSQYIAILKNSSLGAAIAYPDLMLQVAPLLGFDPNSADRRGVPR